MSCDTSARAYCTHIGHQIAPILGMAPPEARAVLLELHELATTRVEAATPAQRSGRTTAQDRLAAARARAEDAAAAEATTALFAEMRSMQPPIPVPSHGEIDPATGLALPKPDAQHGWRAVYETVQAARAGRELPDLAREIIGAFRARSTSTPDAVARAALARMPSLWTTANTTASVGSADAVAETQDLAATAAQLDRSGVAAELREAAVAFREAMQGGGVAFRMARRNLAIAVVTAAGVDRCLACGRYVELDGAHTCPAEPVAAAIPVMEKGTPDRLTQEALAPHLHALSQAPFFPEPLREAVRNSSWQRGWGKLARQLRAHYEQIGQPLPSRAPSKAPALSPSERGRALRAMVAPPPPSGNTFQCAADLLTRYPAIRAIAGGERTASGLDQAILAYAAAQLRAAQPSLGLRSLRGVELATYIDRASSRHEWHLANMERRLAQAIVDLAAPPPPPDRHISLPPELDDATVLALVQQAIDDPSHVFEKRPTAPSLEEARAELERYLDRMARGDGGAQRVAEHVAYALRGGEVDGGHYRSGIIGTIAESRRESYERLAGQPPHKSVGPILALDRLDMAISRGDLPETNPVVAKVLHWVGAWAQARQKQHYTLARYPIGPDGTASGPPLAFAGKPQPWLQSWWTAMRLQEVYRPPNDRRHVAATERYGFEMNPVPVPELEGSER